MTNIEKEKLFATTLATINESDDYAVQGDDKFAEIYYHRYRGMITLLCELGIIDEYCEWKKR